LTNWRKVAMNPVRAKFPPFRPVLFKELFMIKPLHYSVSVFCFALGAPLAHAAATGVAPMYEQMESQHFKEMDTDADGMVSKAEYDANHDKHFKAMDTNGDGKLSPDEMRAGHKEAANESMKKRFDEADANHDGALTREETKKSPMLYRHFDEMDANHDGKVTKEEMDMATEYWRRKSEKMKNPG
jgi:Ca2+-binding EF-hand superfamily protein